MNIEIQRGIKLQKHRPESVSIILTDNNNRTIGVVSVRPKFPEMEKEIFQVSILSGTSPFNSSIDIKVELSNE